MARRGQQQSGARRTAARTPRRTRARDNDGVIPVLARAVREVETAVERGNVLPSVRTKFQVVALLVREERARLKAQDSGTEADRAQQLKRLDGVATILAKSAAADTSLLSLLAEDATVSDSARELRRRMLESAGVEVAEEEVRRRRPSAPSNQRSASCRSPWSPVSSPTPSSPPTSPRPGSPRSARGCSPGGSSSARSSAPSRRRAAARRPACRCPSRPRSTPPADDGSCATRPRSSPRPRRGTGPSSSPTSRGSARPPRRSSPPRPRTPSRSSSSSPTSSRPTGPARPGSGRRGGRRPSCTATATTSTGSPTSSWSTTRCWTGTSAGSPGSASAAWWSTRPTSSRTSRPSAPSTCWSCRSGSAPGSSTRCSWR